MMYVILITAALILMLDYNVLHVDTKFIPSKIIITSLCGRDGRTLCGPQCVIVIR